jgi:hypothetical protein
MSILQEFIAAVTPLAQSIIGAETLSIGGGQEINGTLNEDMHSKDYESGGFEVMSSLSFVIGRSFFISAYPLAMNTYVGKAAFARGENWRVSSVSQGSFFVTIGLESANKSS